MTASAPWPSVVSGVVIGSKLLAFSPALVATLASTARRAAVACCTPALLTLLLSALALVRSDGLPPASNAASAVVSGVTLAVTVEPLAGLVGSTDT